MNSNLFHNLMSLVLTILGALMTFDWTSLGATPEMALKIAGYVVMAVNILKVVVNVNRDGVTGLVKQQPPVE